MHQRNMYVCLLFVFTGYKGWSCSIILLKDRAVPLFLFGIESRYMLINLDFYRNGYSNFELQLASLMNSWSDEPVCVLSTLDCTKDANLAGVKTLIPAVTMKKLDLMLLIKRRPTDKGIELYRDIIPGLSCN